MNSTPTSLRLRMLAAHQQPRVTPRRTRDLALPPAGSDLLPIPGEPGLPLIGNTFPIVQDTVARSREHYRRYGPVSWSNVLRRDFVLVLGPDAIVEVLANRDKAFSSELGWKEFVGPFFDRGLMLMDGEEHLHHRRLMQQAFKRERLLDYMSTMNDVIDRRLAEWQPADDFSFYWSSKQLTLDVATEVFMGAKLGAEADRLNRAFIDLVSGGMALIRHDVPLGKWRKGLRARALLAEYFRSRIDEKRDGDGTDLFSVLCQAEGPDGERFTDEDVINHLIFAMMAAHDTSTITLSTIAYQLAKNPEWQTRVRDEGAAVAGEFLGFDDLDSLTVLDQVFKEALRWNAPAGMLARKSIVDTEVAGHFLPSGTPVWLAVYPTHRMAEWWPDPDKFDPSRFAPDAPDAARVKTNWIPFGSHMHKCLGMHFGGMEVKAILHQILKRFELSAPADYVPPIDYGTGPFPGDGLPLELSKR